MPIYCINLKHRTDRKQHSFNEFKKIGISPDKVIYLPFTKDNRGGVYGCYDSHIKIWRDFFIRFPREKYALVFEDDFVYSSNEPSVSILKKATDFLEKNNEVDILNLHSFCVKVDHKSNNEIFTHGYGFGTHVYFITRKYIETILRVSGSLPEPNGRHIDFEMNFNLLDKQNKIYSDKLFYTNYACFTQLIDKSDNYVNIVDKLFRFDVNKNLDLPLAFLRFLKSRKLIKDEHAKKIHCMLYNLIA
jgi:hypothetical protein